MLDVGLWGKGFKSLEYLYSNVNILEGHWLTGFHAL